ncbi:MAG TPA: oligoribonuclease [Candidatus Saccharimonadales bacterium]|nr:oligoribonuclease [Candidatus Saccharimonadales bacterium]
MDKKLRNLHIDRILWVDLEMTGLSPTDDLILEVAAIATDWDFKELDAYHGTVKNKVSTIKERMAIYSSFWDFQSDSKDALLKQNQDGKSIKIIEHELLEFIDKNFKVGVPVLLGGSSVHVDRRFIIDKWPKVDARLHYRMLDVSAWKVVFEGKYKEKFAKPNAHRALSDIRGSIAELQYYLAKLK